MSSSLKLLIIEDQVNDAELMVYALRRDGFDPDWQRVDTEAEYLDYLHEDLELILADYNLPQFDGLRALHLLQQRGLDVPFIVVTGSLEESGIEAMKAGAADYLLKDRLARLGEAVRRALQERTLRQEKRRAEARAQAFLTLGQRLSAAVTAEEAARVIIDVADELLGWDACTLDLYLPEQGTLEPVLTIDTISGRRVDVPPVYAGKPSSVARRTLAEGAQLILRDSPSLAPSGLIPFGDTSRPSASLVFVPIRYGEQVTGILSIQSYRAQAYDNEALSLLQALADYCGGALNRIQSENAEREQRTFAQALADTAAIFNSTLNLDEVLERILKNVGRVVQHDGVNIMLVESGSASVIRCLGYYTQWGLAERLMRWRFCIQETNNLRHMTESGQPIVIADTQEYPGWLSMPETDWIRSYVGAPIQWEGQVIGFLNLDSMEPNFYADVDAHRLKAFADQVAVAMKNAQLFKGEQERRRIEETLRQASAALNATLSLDEVLSRILEQLGRAIPYDSASVQQLESENLVVRAARGFEDSAKLINLKIPTTAEFPNAHVVDRKEPLAVANIAALYPHFRDKPDIYEAMHIRSWLGVPMIVNDQVIGMITIDRNEIRPYTDEEVELALAFANHAAIALQNANLYQELERYSDVLEQAVEERTAELKRMMERSEAILQNSPDAVLLLRADGAIESANRAFHQMSGYSLGDVRDRFPHYLIHPDQATSFMSALDTTVSAARTMRFEVRARRKDGAIFDADVALAPIKEKDSVVGVVCSLRDISALKEVERMKDAFVSNVSHELRSPITSLKLNRDLLVLNPAKQAVYMERLEREINRLHIIVEDLLRLSRLDRGYTALQLSQMDLNQLAAQYIEDRTPLAQSKGLTIALRQEPALEPVSADEGLIGQVLSILLTNAFNYTPAGGQVVVRTGATYTNESKWVGFSVSDTGPGIAPDEHPHLFERFYRGKVGRDSGAPGTGLGLSIAREIVARHDGRIEVLSEGIPGAGAIFTVWLPAGDQVQPIPA